MTAVHVPCGHCNGEGRVRHPRMTAALSVVAPGWIKTADVAFALHISPENAANLLKRLLGMGLVERRGVGVARAGQYEWRAAQ